MIETEHLKKLPTLSTQTLSSKYEPLNIFFSFEIFHPYFKLTCAYACIGTSASVFFHATKLKLGLETIKVLKVICVFTNSFLHSFFKLLSSIPFGKNHKPLLVMFSCIQSYIYSELTSQS